MTTANPIRFEATSPIDVSARQTPRRLSDPVRVSDDQDSPPLQSSLPLFVANDIDQHGMLAPFDLTDLLASSDFVKPVHRLPPLTPLAQFSERATTPRTPRLSDKSTDVSPTQSAECTPRDSSNSSSQPSSANTTPRSKKGGLLHSGKKKLKRVFSRKRIVDEPELLPRAHSSGIVELVADTDRDALMKAIDGASPRSGASVVFNFEVPTAEPMVRVRSYSSAADLKKTLRAVNSDLSSDDQSSSTSSAMSCASEGSVVRRQPSTSSATSSGSSDAANDSIGTKLHKLAKRASTKKETYTLIEYNPDQLGQAQWQRFMIPNSLIDETLRTALERASSSEDLNEPFRQCKCSENCLEHTMPDAVAKMLAIWLVEPNFAPPSRRMSNALATLSRTTHRFRRGEWAERFRIEKGQTNFREEPPRYIYRFKMFF